MSSANPAVSWAVVTGASSGIGREVALRLAQRRVNVVLVARNVEALRSVATCIEASGARAVVLPFDLTAPGAAGKIDEATAMLDVALLVNSAGFGSGGAFLDTDLVQEAAMLEVNCRAVLELTHHFARRFARHSRGTIVLLSSIVAFQGVARSANYAATKAYIQSLGEALAQELSGAGVRVLTAIPGPTASGFASRAKMNLGQADTAAAVAEDIVTAIMAGHSRVVPGRTGKILLYSLMTAPRFLRVRIMKAIMRSMTTP
ncbi:MAG: SDR family NAD(P)-dependent oxidoreductase [Bryobacteraceae bacterium]|nr:SDR family NAD(P)-dependent oxidoreductase [Bryobacteraceae bacterium]